MQLEGGRVCLAVCRGLLSLSSFIMHLNEFPIDNALLVIVKL